MTVCRILGLHSHRSIDFKSERLRRIYWACYLHSKFSSDNAFANSETFDIELDLILPSRDDDYEMRLCSKPTSIRIGEPNGSIYAELVKALRLWLVARLGKPNTDAND
jgi:hypothetical protein